MPWPWRLVAGLLSLLLVDPSGTGVRPGCRSEDRFRGRGRAIQPRARRHVRRRRPAHPCEPRRPRPGTRPMGRRRFAVTKRAIASRDRRDADPKLAALAHLALGGIYLDRDRVADALREFTRGERPRSGARRTLTPCSASPTARRFRPTPPRPSRHFRRPSALDPTDVVSEYLLARQLATGRQTEDEAARLWRLVARQLRSAGRTSVRSPTARLSCASGSSKRNSGVEPFFPPAAYAEGFALLGARRVRRRRSPRFARRLSRDPLVADQANRYGMRRAADAFRDGSIDTARRAACRRPSSWRPSAPEPHRILGHGLSRPTSNTTAAIDELKTAVEPEPGRRARAAGAGRRARARGTRSTPPSRRCARPSRGFPHRDARTTRWRGCISGRASRPEALKEFQAAVAFNPLRRTERHLPDDGRHDRRAPELRRGDRRLQQARGRSSRTTPTRTRIWATPTRGSAGTTKRSPSSRWR